MNTVQWDEQLQHTIDLHDLIRDQISDLNIFNETLIQLWLKQITILDDHYMIELKSRLKVNVER